MNIIHEVTTTATHFSLPSDIVFILLLVAVIAIYTFWRGKGKGISLIIAIYPSIALYEYLPFLKQYTTTVAMTQAPFITEAAIFLITLLLIHMVINRFMETDYSFSRIGKAFDSTILAILASGLLLWVSYHIVILHNIYAFSPSIAGAFADKYSFYWLAAPLLILFFI